MSAAIHYLPTANIAPLPRRANVGKLPQGIARFGKAKRARDAAKEQSEPMTFWDAACKIREAKRAGQRVPTIAELFGPRGVA